MDLNLIAMFIEVARRGSFTDAARSLGVSKSYLSTCVSKFETELGVTLIHRTTRRLSLTQEGEQYFRKCIPLLGSLAEAQEEIKENQKMPRGLLKITAPAELGGTSFVDGLSKCLSLYPLLRLEILFTDRVVDLVAENFDLAVRAGRLDDSSLMAKKIGESYFVPVASPEYLRQSSPIHAVKDFATHSCLLFSEGDQEVWNLLSPSGRKKVRVTAKLKANSMLALKKLVLAGHGIALLPVMTCEPELSKGKIVLPLPGVQTASEPFHLVYPADRYMTPKLKAVMPEIEKTLREFVS